MMSTARDYLAAVQQRADAATNGPWFGSMGESVVYGRIPGDEVAQCTRRVDARFVQSARTDVPRLVAALTAALDLADEIRERAPHSIRDHTADDFRAAITDALTPKENDRG